MEHIHLCSGVFNGFCEIIIELERKLEDSKVYAENVEILQEKIANTLEEIEERDSQIEELKRNAKKEKEIELKTMKEEASRLKAENDKFYEDVPKMLKIIDDEKHQKEIYEKRIVELEVELKRIGEIEKENYLMKEDAEKKLAAFEKLKEKVEESRVSSERVGELQRKIEEALNEIREKDEKIRELQKYQESEMEAEKVKEDNLRMKEENIKWCTDIENMVAIIDAQKLQKKIDDQRICELESELENCRNDIAVIRTLFTKRSFQMCRSALGSKFYESSAPLETFQSNKRNVIFKTKCDNDKKCSICCSIKNLSVRHHNLISKADMLFFLKCPIAKFKF